MPIGHVLSEGKSENNNFSFKDLRIQIISFQSNYNNSQIEALKSGILYWIKLKITFFQEINFKILIIY